MSAYVKEYDWEVRGAGFSVSITTTGRTLEEAMSDLRMEVRRRHSNADQAEATLIRVRQEGS